MSKSFTIIFDEEGVAEIKLNSYEEESPKIAAEIEKALGGGINTPESVKWKPGNHHHGHVHHKH